MILATTKMFIQSDKKEEFCNNIRAMLEPISFEPGCKSFRFYQDIEQENTFVLVEEWENERALKNHIRTDGFRIILALIEILSAEAPEIKYHRISGTSGMETIGAVLQN